MKLIFAVVLGTLFSGVAMGQNEARDSIAGKELEEVVVEADKMYMTVNKVSFTPTKQQRNASANGTMLLQQLAIPQLRVNALAGSVTTNTGEAVAFFIDGVPATDSDVADINTRDVLRVEVLDYPTDPKFRNSPHVVNYIMQKYEFGGYTKLNTTEMLLSCFSSYNTLNSKMVYKKMTFDARAYYQFTDGSHSGSDQTQVFRLPGYAKEAPDGITRSSLLESSKYIANRPSASFRALYQGDKTQFSSTLDWAFNANRTDNSSGSLLYTPEIFTNNRWSSEYPFYKNSIGWSNDFFQKLPNDWALSATFTLSYDHTNQTQVRTEGSDVIRDLNAREEIWSTQSNLDFSKNFGGKHAVSVNASSVTYKSDIDYTGSTVNTNHQSQFGLVPGASYTFTPDDSFYCRTGLYAAYYHAKTGDVVETKFFPSLSLNLSWMPRKGHRIGAFFNYSLDAPDGSQKNSVLLQTDMLSWSQGNPNLQSYHTMVSQLNYAWMPSQYITVSPMVAWIYKNDYFADTYSLTQDGKGILVRPENCGKYHNVWAAINFSAYAFNRNLIVQVNPLLSHHQFKGVFDKSYTSLSTTMSATYYLGQFYAGASYTTPYSYFNQGDPVKRHTRSQYWLMVGWGNASWTVGAYLINPFRNHWRAVEMSIDTPYYSMNTTMISVNDYRRLNLTVAYTFSYGKKVQRGNDLNGISGSSSSIR